MKDLSRSKPKVDLTGVGILSRFAIMHYYSDQSGVDARIVKDEDKVLDLKGGILIGPNLKLRLASKEDADFLSVYPTSIESVIQYSLHDYVLQCSLEVDDDSKVLGTASRKIRHIISSAVAAFRLLKSGYVDANVILWITTRGTDRHPSLLAEKTIRSHPFGKYILRTDEISKLTDLVERVSNLDFTSRKSLRIALDRFDKSYDEIENEDKLIDYIISFEALFLEGEGRFQHAVIPVACSMLLGKSQKERQEIKELLNLAYEIRNNIVHGSDYEEKLRKKDLELEELISEVENILRASLETLI